MNIFWTIIFALLCYDIIKFVVLNILISEGGKESNKPPVVKTDKSKFARRLEEAMESKKKDGIQKK